jgi:hypothetical protein
MYNGTTGEITNKFGDRLKKTTSVMKYKFVKGDDRAGQYLTDCTVLKKP